QPDRVVAEIAHGAAGEARQAGHDGGGAPYAPAQGREEVVVAAAYLESVHRVAPQERVAGQPLAAHEALEQEGPLAAPLERQRRRHRRQQLARHLADHRHQPALGREPLVLLEGQRFPRPLPPPRSTSSTRATGTCRWCSATSRWNSRSADSSASRSSLSPL